MNLENTYSYLDKNVEITKNKIAAANEKNNEVVLMAAVKSADIGEINYIHSSLGINDIGENRVQQLLERYDKLEKEGLRIHFIGSLQTNKVKYIIDKVHLIHSLDSDKLAREIDKQAKKHGLIAEVLVEINSGGEENKGGISPEDAAEFCRQLQKYENIKLRGFMTMAPRCENKSDYYGYFNRTREVAFSVWKDTLGFEGSPVLSMGMSESFEEAVACGATIVRVGRSLFVKNIE